VLVAGTIVFALSVLSIELVVYVVVSSTAV